MGEEIVPEIVLVQTTLPDLPTAQRVGRALVEAKLAACTQLTPIVSHFYWEGRLEDAKEFRLDIKTTPYKLRGLLSEVELLHPYDVPELLIIPKVQTTARYAQWVATETGTPA